MTTHREELVIPKGTHSNHLYPTVNTDYTQHSWHNVTLNKTHSEVPTRGRHVGQTGGQRCARSLPHHLATTTPPVSWSAHCRLVSFDQSRDICQIPSTLLWFPDVKSYYYRRYVYWKPRQLIVNYSKQNVLIKYSNVNFSFRVYTVNPYLVAYELLQKQCTILEVKIFITFPFNFVWLQVGAHLRGSHRKISSWLINYRKV